MYTAINEVKEGMHSDFSENDQPKGTYRHSDNGEIFTSDGKQFHWKSKIGNVYSFSIRNGFIPIQSHAILNHLYILSVNANGSMSEIGFVNITDSDSVLTYYSIYYKSDLGLSLDYPIKIKGERETENIERIYWRDGNNPPRTLNLYDVIETETQPYCTALIPGKKYINVGDNIFHHADFEVNPGSNFVALFAVPVNTNISRVTKYVPLTVLDWTPNAEAAIMKYDKLVDGLLEYGSYFFLFRYGLNSGFLSSWQEMIGPVNVIDLKDGLISTPQSTLLHDAYQDTQGKSHLQTSKKGVRLSFTNLDPNYDYIQIAYIKAIEEELTDAVKICMKIEILNNSTTTADIIYNFNFGIETIADVLTKNVGILDVFDMAILKYKMNIANVKETAELPIGAKIIGCTIRNEIYEYPIDVRGYPDKTDSQAALISAAINFDDIENKIYPKQQYLVKGTGAETVTYNGTVYGPGDVFIGDALATSFTGTATCVPILRIRKYFDRFNGDTIYDNHELQFAMDYKDPVMSANARGYWGNQNYRFALMAFDEKLSPMFVRFLDDFKTAERNESVKTIKSTRTTMTGVEVPGAYSINGTGGGNTIDVFDGTETDSQLVNSQTTGSDPIFYTGKILSIGIDNIDLTDIIDKIHAFAIVRCVRDATIVSEGFLEPVVQQKGTFGDESILKIRHRSYKIAYHSVSGGQHYQDRTPNWYILVDPEKMFQKNDKANLPKDDVLVLKRYMEVEAGHVETEENLGNYYRKFYCQKTGVPTGGQALESETRLQYFEHIEQEIEILHYVNPNEPTIGFKNVAAVSDAAITNADFGNFQYFYVGGKCTVIKVENDGTDPNYGFGYWPDTIPNFPEDTTTCYLPIVQHIKANNLNYGGTSAYALASSQYIYTGHFQIVNNQFKQRIHKTVDGVDKYIVSGIQIFGGDCYINIFDYKRTLCDYWLYRKYYEIMGYDPAVDPQGEAESIFVPLQSEMNLSLRQDNHVARNRSYALGYHKEEDGDQRTDPQPFDGTGIRHKDMLTGIMSFDRYEQYLYDDTYSSKHVQIKFPGFPEGMDTNNYWPSRTRFSLKKNPGEQIDSYRIFKSDNYRNLNKSGNRITNIFSHEDRLYYFMDQLVGYIPVGERAMNAIDGMQVQMGIGGEYDRYDDRNKFFGVQHMFGIVQVPDGFVWFDSIRKAFIHMTYDFGIKEESLIKGYDHEFSLLNDNIRNMDNVLKNQGVYLFYSPEERTIFGQFNDGVKSFVLGYNHFIKKFIGVFPFRITGSVNMRNHTFTWNGNKNLYLQNRGTKRTWFGVKYPAEIKIIINEQSDMHKAFHVCEFLKASNFFDEVIYETEDGTLIESVYPGNVQSPYYEAKIGKKWSFNIPQNDKEMRLNGTYLAITFRITHNNNDLYDDIEFQKLITQFVDWL